MSSFRGKEEGGVLGKISSISPGDGGRGTKLTLSHPQRTLLLKWVDVSFFKEEEGGKSEVKFQMHFDLQIISGRKSWNFL